jgi:trehalose 6-phosphate synthase
LTRLVAVSNRVAQPHSDVRSAGGLAVGVLAALQEYGGVWFGWNGRTTRGETHEPKLEKNGNITYATIDLNDRAYEMYYNGFSNTSLWPVFHYLLEHFRFDRREFDEYRRVNALFARHLLPLLEPDDVIWVHDYHLIPLASELRRAGVTQPIGFFLHVPFPDIEMLRVLPVYAQLIRSLCSYDVIGFHTPRDLSSFKDAVSQKEIGGIMQADRRLKAGGRLVHPDVFPIGIDVEDCYSLALESQTSNDVKRMAKHLQNRELIIGVDRLDYSKGLLQRFLSFERLIENYPTNRKQVSYVQISPTTRAGVRAYENIRHELEQVAGKINGQYADINWVPIRYLNRSFDRAILMGFFNQSKVGLVTPVRDGMNLVAKEFVAAQNPDNPGMLVLSELARAAHELTDAILVNPYDIDAVADAIHRALSMPIEERRERHASMMIVLKHNNITAWRKRFMDALLAVDPSYQAAS